MLSVLVTQKTILKIMRLSLLSLFLLSTHTNNTVPYPSSDPQPESYFQFLKRKIYKLTEKERCLFCKDPLALDRIYATLPCGHKYHYRCIREWSKKCSLEYNEKYSWGAPTCFECHAPFNLNNL